MRFTSKNNITNKFSNNAVLKKLNLAILLLTKQLKSGESYDLDFDNQFFPCEKYDTKKGYTMERVYFPGIASIGKNIVYLENRNGNANVKFKQEDAPAKGYKILNANNKKIKRSWMDCGSFTTALVKVVEGNNKLFYIRVQR